MSDLETGKTTFDFSIYRQDINLSKDVSTKTFARISYCSADSTYTHVFAFIAVNRDESLECHAFLGRKQKIVSKNQQRIVYRTGFVGYLDQCSIKFVTFVYASAIFI